MDLLEYFRSHSLTQHDLIAAVQKSIRLETTDMLFVAGSLVEGWGNAKSDLDVFLLTQRTNIPLTSLDAIALQVGGSLIDVRVRLIADVEALLKRFQCWANQPRLPRNALGIPYDDRKFLHRLCTGKPIFGEALLETLRRSLAPKDLARHKLDCARFLASTIQIDLSGMYHERDFLSMPFAAQDLLGYTADALTAGYGSTNPNPKWRVRELKTIPCECHIEVPGCSPELSVSDTFVELHRAPVEINALSAFRHASRSVGFSRAAFARMEYRLLEPAASPPPQLSAVKSVSRSDECLPHLDFDIQVSCKQGHFQMWRLNVPDTVFELSPLGFSIACLCDGETSKQSAIQQAAVYGEEEGATMTVNRICEAIEYGHFELPAPVDERVLHAILQAEMRA